MTDGYKGTTPRGDFFAFWRSDPNTLSFFTPSPIGNEYFSYSMSEWDSIRANYLARDTHDFGSYDDLINAAWHYLGQRLTFVDRRTIVRSTVEPGVYYSRIWRGYRPAASPLGNYNAVHTRKQYGYRYTQSAVATASLFDRLLEIFQHVEPSANNYHTYGHKMRELLLLACTEIESEWRAVLEENSRSEHWRERYTTADYFRVKEPLRLDD